MELEVDEALPDVLVIDDVADGLAEVTAIELVDSVLVAILDD